jgi:hypothetical protein
LGWVEIRHPFHPLRGQSFPVVKKRRVAGVDTLILRGLEHGTFSIAREWTDWADPSLSLIERYKPCGKQGCKCARGPGHGPKYYLSVSHYGQRPQMDYIPQDYYRQTTEYVANYHRLRQMVDEICAINRELLSRREAL